MIALSQVIDFLLGLMGDEGKRLAFDQNPQQELSAAGLDGLTGQDVRDAQLQMCDSGMIRSGGGGGGGGSGGGGGGGGGGGAAGGGRHTAGDDPVQAIQHTTATFHVTEVTETTIVTIDDRDVIFNDSFNSDDDVTIIDDSFNDSSSVVNDVTAIQDNDTIINDNDTINIEDNDTEIGEVVVGGPGEPQEPAEPAATNPPVGIATEDIVGPGAEPAEETDVAEPAEEAATDEPEPEVDDAPDFTTEVEPDPDPADAAIV